MPVDTLAGLHTGKPKAPLTQATQAAHIVGKVQFREGDGPLMTIRPGPCEVETTELDATLSWTEGDSNLSTAMPVNDFKRYIATGAIRLEV